MQAVKKVARSGSLIVEEIFGNKSKKTETDPAEVAYESAFNGKIDFASNYRQRILCNVIKDRATEKGL